MFYNYETYLLYFYSIVDKIHNMVHIYFHLKNIFEDFCGNRYKFQYYLDPLILDNNFYFHYILHINHDLNFL